MSTAPVMQNRVRDPRQLLVDRAVVLLRRMGRALGRGWKRYRLQRESSRSQPGWGGLGAVMGRALAGKSSPQRMLAVEERLTLGPKQHMYLVRCGEQRLLVASAGEAAIHWMPLPEAGGTAQTPAKRGRNAAAKEAATGGGKKPGAGNARKSTRAARPAGRLRRADEEAG